MDDQNEDCMRTNMRTKQSRTHVSGYCRGGNGGSSSNQQVREHLGSTGIDGAEIRIPHYKYG